MAKKKRAGILSSFKNIVVAHVKRIGDIALLAKLETRLAAKTVIMLFVAGMAVFIFFLTGWIALCGCFFLFLARYGQFSLIASAFFVFLFNLVSLIGALTYIFKIKENLFFNATRKHIALLGKG